MSFKHGGVVARNCDDKPIYMKSNCCMCGRVIDVERILGEAVCCCECSEKLGKLIKEQRDE